MMTQRHSATMSTYVYILQCVSGAGMQAVREDALFPLRYKHNLRWMLNEAEL